MIQASVTANQAAMENQMTTCVEYAAWAVSYASSTIMADQFVLNAMRDTLSMMICHIYVSSFKTTRKFLWECS